ncbi:hypothetical protein EYC84_002630 [Monilinia fructicola]|uniref:Uncharacterized protein n=1 Tax=Monilinia fructicola TaxID=38448 RepID=A0A5M9JLG3_MONFR|nr:hypothetical protein EYC84_002630 [Monilinia fructicola]
MILFCSLSRRYSKSQNINPNPQVIALQTGGLHENTWLRLTKSSRSTPGTSFLSKLSLLSSMRFLLKQLILQFIRESNGMLDTRLRCTGHIAFSTSSKMRSLTIGTGPQCSIWNTIGITTFGSRRPGEPIFAAPPRPTLNAPSP